MLGSALQHNHRLATLLQEPSRIRLWTWHSPEVPTSSRGIAAVLAAIDLVAETQDTITVAKRQSVAGRVGDPKLQFLVGSPSISTLVLDLSTTKTSRCAVANIVQDVVRLHLIWSPGLASAVAASLSGGNDRRKGNKKGRRLHNEVDPSRRCWEGEVVEDEV